MKYIVIFCLCFSFDICAEQSDESIIPMATGACGTAGKEISRFIIEGTFRRLKKLDPSVNWQVGRIISGSSMGPYNQRVTFAQIKKSLIDENIDYKEGSATQEADAAGAAKKFSQAMGSSVDETKLADILKRFLNLNGDNMLAVIEAKNNVTLLTYEKSEQVYEGEKYVWNCVYLHLAPTHENIKTHVWQFRD